MKRYAISAPRPKSITRGNQIHGTRRSMAGVHESKKNLPRVDVFILVLIEWHSAHHRRGEMPPHRRMGPVPPVSTAFSLIRISLLRLDGCRVESRPMRWPAVFGIRPGEGGRRGRQPRLFVLDEWLAWLLCLAWEYVPFDLGAASVLEAARFMKYPIGYPAASSQCETFDWNAPWQSTEPASE